MHMFLPDYIESGFNHASLTTDGQETNLVARTDIINKADDSSYKAGFFTPFVVFGLLFLLVLLLTIYEFRKGKNTI